MASDVEKNKFSYVFQKTAYRQMSDRHLWFSIFSLNAVNHFTRVQRCTCCFVLLVTAMLLNILYYAQVVQVKNNKPGGLELGPIFISKEQVSMDVECFQIANSPFRWPLDSSSIYFVLYQHCSSSNSFDASNLAANRINCRPSLER